VDPIVAAAGTALVGAMAADTWQQAREAAVALWRRIRPEEADGVEAELGELRAEVVAARRNGDRDTERALVGDWQLRLQRLLRSDPAGGDEIRRAIAEELAPLLAIGHQVRVDSPSLYATASGRARVYQAGRDQHIHER